MAARGTHYKPSFSLYRHLMGTRGAEASVILGGSATPALSLTDLVSLSSEPEVTRQVLTSSLLEQRLGLASDRGSHALRAAITATYGPSVTADNVLVANGTSGANHIVERALLSPGDHVIVQYPVYGPCVEEPLDIGCELSFLRCDASSGWRVDPDDLQALIRPGQTKMVFLNSPGNPTGTYIDAEAQRAIIRIAKQHGLVVHCDEIFRPLFHHDAGPQASTPPPSFVEHPDLDYDRIAVTSSLSKSYGLSGVRVGWIATPSAALYHRLLSYRMFSVHALSQLDETVATEVLSPRCRPAILQKHLSLARRNLDLIEEFIAKYEGRVDWVRPTAGAVAFVRFLDPATGRGRDDVDFCERLVREKRVLLSPGSLCFEFEDEDGKLVDGFKGRVRFHFTCPTEVLKAGLKGIAEFLDQEQTAAIAR